MSFNPIEVSMAASQAARTMGGSGAGGTGGGLPVVELSTTIENNAMPTSEEGLKLDAAFENNTPVVLRCSVRTGADAVAENCAMTANRGFMQGIPTYMFDLNGTTFAIMRMPEGVVAGVAGWVVSTITH